MARGVSAFEAARRRESGARRAPAKRKAPAKRHQRNPPAVVVFGNPAVKIGKEVDLIRYVHVTEGPRVHEFANNGVRMEGLPDGSIRIWHPRIRLWEDR